jgi:tetratricopeptide (TPR) repeat protein
MEALPDNDRVYFNLGMLGMDDGDFASAEKWFRKAIDLKPDFRSALFNLALLLNERKRPLEAVPFLKSLLAHFPDHVKGLVLLGDIYTNHVRDFAEAERCYRRILEIDPGHVQASHNLCVVHVERGELAEAEACLKAVQELAPGLDYVDRHLSIVENRIKLLKEGTPAEGGT